MLISVGPYVLTQRTWGAADLDHLANAALEAFKAQDRDRFLNGRPNELDQG